MQERAPLPSDGLALRGGAGVDAIAGGGHQGAGADGHDKAQDGAPIAATTTTATKRKESAVKQRKEPAKRFKPPARPMSPILPLGPSRSIGVNIMLSPRISPKSLLSPANTTSPATDDVSSSNDVIDVEDNENDETEKAAIARATKNLSFVISLMLAGIYKKGYLRQKE